MINDRDEIPVCKLLNYEKFIQEEKKAEKKKDKKQSVQLKEFRFKYGIADNDIKVKMNNAEKALNKGHNVLLSIAFPGRAVVFINDTYQEHIEKLLSNLNVEYVFVSKPKIENYKVNFIIKKKNI